MYALTPQEGKSLRQVIMREREIEGERDSLKRLVVYEERMNGWLDLV